MTGSDAFTSDNTKDEREMKDPLLMIREEWERTFDAIPDCITILDVEHKIVRVNRAMANKLNVAPESCTGIHCYEVIHGSKCPPSFCPHSKLLQDREEHTSEVHEDNLGGYFLVTASPIYDEDKNVVGSVHVARDITGRKIMEDQLQNALESRNKLLVELIRSNKELEQFAYAASHDLQEPLRMVSNFLQLLKKRYKGKLDDDAEEFIHYAVDGAQRMQLLINDLLTYSRLNTRDKEFEEIDMEKVLDESLLNLKLSIEESGAKITHHQLPMITADHSQMVLVLQNLIRNAVKFRAENKPEIKVTTEARDDHWVFCVSDNGIGIDPQHKNRVFKVFQRLHNMDQYPGTGIGLSICQKIVIRHGGEIWVDSELGKGSKFCFSIDKDL